MCPGATYLVEEAKLADSFDKTSCENYDERQRQGISEICRAKNPHDKYESIPAAVIFVFMAIRFIQI